MVGRPSAFTQDIADAICAGLADARSLRSICLDDDMPSQSMVFRWLADEQYASFREQYAHARASQADALFDEMLDIADDASNDFMERKSDKGDGWELNGEHVQRTRLRLDTRKWMAARLAPKKYGDKIDHTHANPDGTSIVFLTTVEAKPDRVPDAD